MEQKRCKSFPSHFPQVKSLGTRLMHSPRATSNQIQISFFDPNLTLADLGKFYAYKYFFKSLVRHNSTQAATTFISKHQTPFIVFHSFWFYEIQGEDLAFVFDTEKISEHLLF